MSAEQPGPRAATVVTYDFARYSPSMHERVVELMTHLTLDDVGSAARYFDWKYRQNPLSADPIIYVAIAGDQVVAMRGFLPSRWMEASGSTTTALCACDLVVDPAYRRRGIPRQLMRFALEDLAKRGGRKVLSLSASPITFRMSIDMGWRRVLNYENWALTTRRRRWADRFAGALKALPGLWRFSDAPFAIGLTAGFDEMDRRHSRRGSGTRIAYAPQCDPKALAAGSTKWPHSGVVQQRSTAFYDWRLRNPGSRYRCVTWKSVPDAWLLLQTARYQSGADVAIVDHAAPDVEVLVGMIDEVVRIGGFDRLAIWTHSLPEAVKDALRRLHFEATPPPRTQPSFRAGMLWCDLRREPILREGDNAVAWNPQMLDSDYY